MCGEGIDWDNALASDVVKFHLNNPWRGAKEDGFTGSITITEEDTTAIPVVDISMTYQFVDGKTTTMTVGLKE